jgi:hypothetical protein
MPYCHHITELRSPRLRPYAAAALAEARGYSDDDLASITGESGRRHYLLAAAAYQFADEAATEAEERALADEARRQMEEVELAEYLARQAGTAAARRAVEEAVAAAGWSIEWRHGSLGGSAYFWLVEPGEDGERHSLRISDHHAPGGAGWNDERQERHAAPDINIVIRRVEGGDYTFDLGPIVEILNQ